MFALSVVRRPVGGVATLLGGGYVASGSAGRDKLPEPIEDDTAPLLGTPEEVIARLKQLEAGGATNILLVDPNASVGNLRAFAREVMPGFRPASAAVAE